MSRGKRRGVAPGPIRTAWKRELTSTAVMLIGHIQLLVAGMLTAGVDRWRQALHLDASDPWKAAYLAALVVAEVLLCVALLVPSLMHLVFDLIGYSEKVIVRAIVAVRRVRAAARGEDPDRAGLGGPEESEVEG